MDTQLAVIGGSQAYFLLESGELSGERLDPVSTPFGESQPIFRLEIGGKNVLFLSRHGEKGYRIAAPWVNYRANIWALKELGTERIVSWSGPAAIDPNLEIGQFVIPDDLVDETRCRPQSFFEGKGWGFVRQESVFCPCMSEILNDAAEQYDLNCKNGGTYVCTEGPRLETKAEIRKYKLYGGELVGMSLAPEVFLAKELEMCYASICYITNYAEGLRVRRFRPGELFEGLLDPVEKESVDRAISIFPYIAAAVAASPKLAKRDCSCPRYMERYRQRGDIGEDWHTWI